MKSYCSVARLTVFPALLFALLAAGGGASGQVPVAGGSTVMNAAMVKLFGATTAFTSRVEFRVLDKARKQTDSVPMGYTFLDGKTRMEIDMNQVKSVNMPPAFIPTLRQFGMDQAVIISRPDRKVVLSVYPRVKSYAEIAMTKDEAAAADKSYTVAKTVMGQETIDGHHCEKNKVTLTGDKGEKVEALVWNAPDLKDFPLQIQVAADADSTVVMKFKEVKLVKPDASQFEAPAGLTKYTSAEALYEVMSKAQDKSGGKK
jgi:hypothetical protein